MHPEARVALCAGPTAGCAGGRLLRLWGRSTDNTAAHFGPEDTMKL